jgi:hypothetical protein
VTAVHPVEDTNSDHGRRGGKVRQLGPAPIHGRQACHEP